MSMREIKYQVWDKVTKTMWENINSLVFEDGKLIEVIFYNNGEDTEWLPANKVCLRQYTGLRDINNVEIYEGDILKTTELYQVNFIVEYSDRSFELFNGRDGIVSDEHNDWSEYEVIGNIYENPKLCKILK